MRAPLVRVAAVVGAATLVGGGVAAYATRSTDPAARYRLASAAVGDVAQTLATTGTVDASGRSDVSFAVAGTVARVRVHEGQHVRAGQVLMTLERSSLKAAVTEARATLARARAQLEADEIAQEDAVSDAASSSSDSSSSDSSSSDSSPSAQPTSAPSAGGSEDAVAAAIQDALAQLHDRQDAVTDGQSVVSEALEAAQAALDTQTEACADAFGSGDSADDQAADSTATETPDPDQSTDDGSTDDGSDAACTAALADVQAAQEEVADAENDLADALAALGSTMVDALAAIDDAAASSAGDQPSDQSSDQSSDQPSSSQPSSSPAASQPDDSEGETAPTAAQLAADQAQIDRAEADLLTAQSELDQATVVAPTAGQVVRVDPTPGDAVAAGDEAAVVVSGSGAMVTTTIGENDIRKVEVGQRVLVTPPGSKRSDIGTVTSIGLTADSSSGTASYAVTVAVANLKVPLPTGSSASLEIVIGRAADAVTVPVSAVDGNGDLAVVRVFRDGVLTPTPVTLGLVGARTVEIADGVEAGDQVVLADLEAPITGASDQLGGGPTFMGPEMRMEGPAGGGPVTFSK